MAFRKNGRRQEGTSHALGPPRPYKWVQRMRGKTRLVRGADRGGLLWVWWLAAGRRHGSKETKKKEMVALTLLCFTFVRTTCLATTPPQGPPLPAPRPRPFQAPDCENALCLDVFWGTQNGTLRKSLTESKKGDARSDLVWLACDFVLVFCLLILVGVRQRERRPMAGCVCG